MAVDTSGLLGLLPNVAQAPAWVSGSDAPEKTDLKLGFIPLTDCAPLVVAAAMGFDRKYGLKFTLSREPSWASVRDKLASGELDAAHVLYGLVYGLHLGVGGPQKDMAVLMTLSRNGQGISLSRSLQDQGVADGPALAGLIKAASSRPTFAQTFPTGTHAMWLYYWLASFGIDPLRDIESIVVPPPQMVTAMKAGQMVGFCAGEPWNARAIADNVGFTAATSQDIWPDHPEKVLGTTENFVEKYPNTCRAMIMAILEACRYIDIVANREKVAKLIASKAYVNASENVIVGRFLGQYENGLGKQWQDSNYMQFFSDGAVNFPYLSDGMWFLTQHKRWGLLKSDPDYLGVAKQINKTDLYSQAATALNIPVPKDAMRKSTLIDGVVWDGSDPVTYAASFKLKA
ncbi:MAG: CmpA/NrtA family ABC transporter substrate-binding protein [Formivibrio sp.]|nr:CmpA/NrtA family ABC transporter substrate-binding protein [Formivibrio sp.]